MPRVNHVKKAAKDNPVVKAGQPYYWWKFRHGGKHYSTTYPRPSQLTQSEFWSTFYGIQEQIEDFEVPSVEDATRQCDECNGTGEVSNRCPECAGEGKVYETSRDLVLQTEIDCPDCQGEGYTHEPCEECDSTGEVENEDASWKDTCREFGEDIESQIEDLGSEMESRADAAPEGLEYSPTFEMIRERAEAMESIEIPDVDDFDNPDDWYGELSSVVEANCE